MRDTPSKVTDIKRSSDRVTFWIGLKLVATRHRGFFVDKWSVWIDGKEIPKGKLNGMDEWEADDYIADYITRGEEWEWGRA